MRVRIVTPRVASSQHRGEFRESASLAFRSDGLGPGFRAQGSGSRVQGLRLGFRD